MRQLISLPIIISAAPLAAAITTAHAGSGAIAASMSNDGVIGFAYGSGTQEDAARWAMLDCRDKGGSDCRLLGSETEQCLVLIGKPGLYVTRWTPTTKHRDAQIAPLPWLGE